MYERDTTETSLGTEGVENNNNGANVCKLKQLSCYIYSSYTVQVAYKPGSMNFLKRQILLLATLCELEKKGALYFQCK